MTAAFFLGQDVNLAGELGQGLDGAGLSQNLATLDAGTLNTTQQSADVVASLSVVQQLVTTSVLCCVALTRRRLREARFCASPTPSSP